MPKYQSKHDTFGLFTLDMMFYNMYGGCDSIFLFDCIYMPFYTYRLVYTVCSLLKDHEKIINKPTLRW